MITKVTRLKKITNTITVITVIVVVIMTSIDFGLEQVKQGSHQSFIIVIEEGTKLIDYQQEVEVVKNTNNFDFTSSNQDIVTLHHPISIIWSLASKCSVTYTIVITTVNSHIHCCYRLNRSCNPHLNTIMSCCLQVM